MRTFKVYPFINFQMCNILLFSHCAVHYIIAAYFIIGTNFISQGFMRSKCIWIWMSLKQHLAHSETTINEALNGKAPCDYFLHCCFVLFLIKESWISIRSSCRLYFFFIVEFNVLMDMFLAFCFLFFFGFFGYNTKTTSNKSKNPHGSYIILKNIYTIKGKKKWQQSEKASYRMGENIVKPSIWCSVNTTP